MNKLFLAPVLFALLAPQAFATVTVDVQSLIAPVSKIGTVTFQDTQFGLLVTPNLKTLPAGIHGFHLHENPSCDKDGNGAGGHFDPKATHKHLGPYTTAGHLGDFPALFVDTDGTATVPTIAPKLTENAILGHALIIHVGKDNYSDKPEKLGGGGARIACGVIPDSHK